MEREVPGLATIGLLIFIMAQINRLLELAEQDNVDIMRPLNGSNTQYEKVDKKALELKVKIDGQIKDFHEQLKGLSLGE